MSLMQVSDGNVADLLFRQDPGQADRIAVSDPAHSLTGAELAQAADRFAGWLSAQGIGEGDRVAIIVDKLAEVVAAMFGCYRAGAVLVPVNPQLKARQISHIVRDSGARIIAAAPKREPILAGLDPAAALGILVAAGGAVLPGPTGTRLPERRPAGQSFPTDRLATLFYTSGSTGLPKAVACTHENILAGAQSVASYLENDPDDVILAILPLSFDAGFSQLTTGLASGAHIVLRDYLLPNDIARACGRYGVTGLTGVPAIWAAALRAGWAEDARNRIRYFANTGGHLAHGRIEALMALFPNARPYPMYGLTEAFRSSYLPPDKVMEKRGSIGKAIPGATLVVVDERGEACPPGETGELVHAGPTVALGYWNNPEETARRFRPAPPALNRLGISGTVVFSGDDVRCDEDGFLYYEGRRDGQIKISGNRISFAEIEELALTHPQVRACAAGGRKTGIESDPELILFIETEAGGAVVDQVSEILRSELPGFSVPSRILALERLILNTNGKYDVGRMMAEFADADRSDEPHGDGQKDEIVGRG